MGIFDKLIGLGEHAINLVDRGLNALDKKDEKNESKLDRVGEAVDTVTGVADVSVYFVKMIISSLF